MTPAKPMYNKRCFHCQCLGHFVFERSDKRVVSLAKYQTSIEDLDGIEDEAENELLLNGLLKKLGKDSMKVRYLYLGEIIVAFLHTMSLNKERISFTLGAP